MEKYLKKLPKEIQGIISLAGDLAQRQGVKAYLIGGFVRDLLLGADNLDLDIACEGDGIRFAEALAGKLQAELICHKRFGTATVKIAGQLKIDIASTRKECYPQPACLPVIRKGLLQDDLFRRDFTINTLAVSLGRNDFGRLVDLFNGRRDIQNGIIRILHDASFVDDPTRILRAIRFEQRYDFRIEPHTMDCLKKALKQKMLNVVQSQRLRQEMILLLRESAPWKPIKRMQQITGFGFVDSRLCVSKKTARLFCAAGRQISWFRKNVLQPKYLNTWLIYFMALLGELSKERVNNICRKFVFSKDEEKKIVSYAASRSNILAKLSQEKLIPSEIFRTLEDLSLEVILLIKSGTADKRVQKKISDFLNKYQGIELAVGGDDLIKQGFIPGPEYQKIFRELLNAKLNGKLKNRKEELEFLRGLGKNK